MSDTYESHTQAADRLQVEREILADRCHGHRRDREARGSHPPSDVSERHLRYLAASADRTLTDEVQS